MNPDMSPKAISARLKRVSELRRVCLALGRAKPAKPISTSNAKTVREKPRAYPSPKAVLEIDGIGKVKRGRGPGEDNGLVRLKAIRTK